MQVQTLVLNYREFLLASWAPVSQILAILDWDNSPYFVDEWMQTNWELLVERQLNSGISILPYGFNQSDNARYLDSRKISNHRIMCCREENPGIEKYIFLCFAGRINDGFEQGPPFDYAFVEERSTKRRFGTKVQGLYFTIAPIPALDAGV